MARRLGAKLLEIGLRTYFLGPFTVVELPFHIRLCLKIFFSFNRKLFY